MASELDDLRSFLEERFALAYPELDTSPGSVADTEVISPLISRLAPDPYDTPIEDFLSARLRSEFPDLVVQKGEPIVDLGVNPNRIFLEPFRRQVAAILRNQSFANSDTLNDREADALAANFFADRALGGFSVGLARLYYSQPRFSIVQPTNAVFTGSGLRFFPVESQAISAEDMLFNQEGSRYYFDVLVRSESEGDEYNIDADTLVGIENLPEVIDVRNLAKFEEGSSRETTEEFLARVETGLSERALVSLRGIRARLTGLFESVRTISVVGYNDVEMERDIVQGSPGETYAFGSLTAVNGAQSVFVAPGNITNGTPGTGDFATIGLAEGDILRRVDLSTGTITDHTVTEIVSPIQARVTPPPPDIAVASPFMVLGPNRGQILLSGIPGGILEPQTPNGEIIVQNNELHIGGMTDVFIRAGQPQDREINLISIRDAEPLHFGLDLETFGADADEFVQVTEKIEDGASTNAAFVGPGDLNAVIYIKVYDSGDQTVPWLPTLDDVGRYIELLGTGGAGPDFGLYEITLVGAVQDFGGERAVPVTITTQDEHTGTNTVGISDRSSVFDLDYRIVAKVSKKDRVRDLDSPQVDFNGNQDGVGAEVGDSVVLESGGDAGIYTVRRILTSLGEDDTLVLDRTLSSTVTPSGAGDGTGIRYRLADELQVDLVSPRVTKVPLGDSFPGGDLQSIAGSGNVSFSGATNPLLAGVEVGDTLEITSGNNAGEYSIASGVTSSGFVVTPTMPSTASNQEFLIYRAFDGIQRPLVRVAGVELLDSTEQPTGITVPYGKEVDVRVLGQLSNRSNGANVESFGGEIVAGPAPLLLFRDLSVDFLAQRVRSGNRLQIFEGDSAAEYEIADVAPPNGSGSANELLIRGAAEGGRDFLSAGADLQYRIGEPSTGIARIYFLEPTSVEVQTGLEGGRLVFSEAGQEAEFRFSSVPGKVILPVPASGDDDPRGIRVVRNYSVGGGQYETILELTDNSLPDAYGLEIQNGDLFVVQEEVELRDSGGTDLRDLGVYGTPAGLRTVTGSNRVSVPANSHIDFTQMGDLVGKKLSIESGPDEGIYTIQEVLSSKMLALDAVMSSSTLTIKGRDTSTLYDAQVIDPGDGFPWLNDPTDAGQLPSVGEYVTIFEGGSSGIEGTFEVLERDFANKRVRLSGYGASLPVASGLFTWVATDSTTPSGAVEYPFRIYEGVGKEVQVTKVATTADPVTPSGTGNVQAGLLTFQGGAGDFATTAKGDRLEILQGVNSGVYPISSVAGDIVTVYSAHPFSAIQTNVPYRVWAGLHGPTTMVTVAGFEGSDGRIDSGQNMIFRVRRPSVFRLSSTEMSENVDDSGLYYVDLQIESMGPGDDRNLAANSRLTVSRGLRADGYTYSVENRTLTFSMYEEVKLNFDRRFLPVGNSDLPENMTEVSGRNLQIQYETSTTVQLINSFLRSDSERVVTANPIARHFLPSFLLSRFVYTGGASQPIVAADLEEYVNRLGALDRLEVSDLLNLISRRGAGFIENPITLVSVTHDLARNLVVERSQNYLGGDEVPYDGTARISSFFADTEDGLTVIRQ